MAPSSEYPLARAGQALRWNDVDIGYPKLAAMADAAFSTVDGLPGGGPVGLLGRKSPGTIAVVLACLRAGRPFLLPSPDLGADVRAELFRVAGCRSVLHTDGLLVEPVDGADDPADLADVGFMLATSGSTGVPKVVPLPRDAVAAFTAWAAGHFGIGPGTVVFNYAPLNFDLCLLDVWTTLAHGGRVVLVDPERALDGRYLLRTFGSAEVEVVQGVPMFYRLLLDAARAERKTFPHVRELVCTGDATPTALLRELPEVFPNARLHNVYGCTETNDSFIHEIDPALDGPVPIGRPIPGVRAVVVDDDGEEVTGEGTGELLVSTPFQAGRYLDPALTGKSWSEGFFRSGDRVRRDADGLFHLVGRTDFQVKVRGVRTNLQEVERVMLDHPGVADAVVLAVPDDTAGARLHAIVRRAPGVALNSLGLRRHCAANLPRTAIPSELDITDDELPRTSTGKVDRKQLTKGVRPSATIH